MADAESPPAAHAVAAGPALEMPAMMDIEASGLDADSYPIEIGYVLPDGQAHCTLIRPAPRLDLLGSAGRAHPQDHVADGPQAWPVGR
jgi:hypothetical protein